MMEWRSDRVPRAMSTQHPDNAHPPAWCSRDVVEGEDEVREAFYAYSQLGCEEVMWDSEGKDVDTRVVRKLLASYGEFFKERVLGEDVYLTYRIPNPRVEGAERKVVAETLLNVAVGCDVATAFYGRQVTPIFEVILPFTKSAEEAVGAYEYYRSLASHAASKPALAEWVGWFRPSEVNVIPLVEDAASLMNVDSIVEPYASHVGRRAVRVFIARSDPALNYGLPCAVILAKMALAKLEKLRERGLEPYPIIGVGSLPFRGGLAPHRLKQFLEEYRGVYTVTIQSSLKYDHPMEEARGVIEQLKRRLPSGEAVELSCEEELIRALWKLRGGYEEVVEGLAGLVNRVAAYVPPRRARKLHIGLFGYSRGVRGTVLPRAIPFACSMYSLGIPPELLGLRKLRELSEGEWRALEGCYVNLRLDLEEAARYVSLRNLEALKEARGFKEFSSALRLVEEDLKVVEEQMGVKLGPKSSAERRHENAVNSFLLAFMDGEEEAARSYLLEAAKIRRSLG